MSKTPKEHGTYIPQRNLIRCNGDWGLAALLSQIEYWTTRAAQDWIHKQYQEWEKEMMTPTRTLQTQFRKLEELGLIERRVAKSQYYGGQRTLLVKLKPSVADSQSSITANKTASRPNEIAEGCGRNRQYLSANPAETSGNSSLFSITETLRESSDISLAERPLGAVSAREDSFTPNEQALSIQAPSPPDATFGRDLGELGGAVNGKSAPVNETQRGRREIAKAIQDVFEADGITPIDAQVNTVAKRLYDQGYSAEHVPVIYKSLKSKQWKKQFSPFALAKHASVAVESVTEAVVTQLDSPKSIAGPQYADSKLESDGTAPEYLPEPVPSGSLTAANPERKLPWTKTL